MASEAEQLNLDREAVSKQAEAVRQLKSAGASKEDVAAAVAVLKDLKKVVSDKEVAMKGEVMEFSKTHRSDLGRLLISRFFYCPAFEIYNGVKGLYDYGPPGCALKANIIAEWRRHFVLTEGMLEIACTALTPAPVLKASGHVDRFTDFLVRDVGNDESYRADHLLEAAIEKILEKEKDPDTIKELKDICGQVDSFTDAELDGYLKRFNVKAPETGNDLSFPTAFNLMFSTSIGPSGNTPGYLRPETAQGIFVNFSRLLGYNNGRVPFAAAQIGDGFRNEIAPRAGLLRVREFTMAEIEHFVDPADKRHAKFATVADVVLTLYPQENQLGDHEHVRMSVGDAVAQGIIDNETLGYFLARTHQFLLAIGIKPSGLRFRQHLANEMAHYATDCWDAECYSTYGWIEVAGHADRSCYDLDAHAFATGETLSAFRQYDEPIEVVELQAKLNRGPIGKKFRGDAAKVFAYIESLDQTGLADLQSTIASGAPVVIDETEFEIDDSMVTVTEETVRKAGENFVPGVIEPSFGIGRILYCLLEQSFWTRENDSQRGVLSLPPVVAPVKCSVLPLSNNAAFTDTVAYINETLTKLNIAYKTDSSGVSIGKRYARTDEIAIPFAITVDFDTVKDRTVTLRDRDSTEQVRGPIDDIIAFVKAMVDGSATWKDGVDRFDSVNNEAPSE